METEIVPRLLDNKSTGAIIQHLSIVSSSKNRSEDVLQEILPGIINIEPHVSPEKPLNIELGLTDIEKSHGT